MNLQELLTYSAPQRLVVQNRTVFFNTHDADLAAWWADQGATVTPWYSDQEQQRHLRTGYDTRQGYEVDLYGALDQIIELHDGDEVDVTRDVLCEAARAA